MLIKKSVIENVYYHMQDDTSKSIFASRLNYSLTGDSSFLDTMVDTTLRSSAVWIRFLEELGNVSDKELVIFGAGIWGKILYKETACKIKWDKVIDNKPEGKTVDNLPVISVENFMEAYNEETVVISSYKNSEGMLQQLLEGGIPKENIINAGDVIFELTEKAIYFDLEVIAPEKEEFFIDAGCFDGLTTRQFLEWSKGNGYSYCFEPDEANILRIEKNLAAKEGRYEIIKSAVWSKDCTLSFNAKGNYASSVSENSMSGDHVIKAVALDSCLKDKSVTFIKMDIEGAELEALKGVSEIIALQKPKLAISIYHKAEDIWTIPQLILEICPEYRFYLRHYSFGSYDTVLYAVCNRK